jgi:Polyketide cyclase / dehydrase and lipid transport
MARITGEIVIARPVDVVFDCVADQRNEPKYNPGMVRSEKLTDGPVDVGTRFGATMTSGRRRADMVIEVTKYDRPRTLGSKTTTTMADIEGTLTFQPASGGTRMRWSWDLRPKGAVRLLTPLVVRMGQRQERRIWGGLKEYLEVTQKPRPPGL